MRWKAKAKPSRATVAVFAGLGLLLLFLPWGYVLAERAWLIVDRDSLTETTTGDRWRDGGLMGMQVAITVEGPRHWCVAGSWRSRHGEQTVVAYDPDDPSRCREKIMLSQASGREITSAAVWAAGVVFLGVRPLWRALRRKG